MDPIRRKTIETDLAKAIRLNSVEDFKELRDSIKETDPDLFLGSILINHLPALIYCIDNNAEYIFKLLWQEVQERKISPGTLCDPYEGSGADVLMWMVGHSGRMPWLDTLMKQYWKDGGQVFFHPELPCSGGGGRSATANALLVESDDLFYLALQKYSLEGIDQERSDWDLIFNRVLEDGASNEKVKQWKTWIAQRESDLLSAEISTLHSEGSRPKVRL